MDYQSTLEISNALDFEDIMVKSLGVILARPSTVAHIQHILVDELYVNSSVCLPSEFAFSQPRY